MGGAEVKTTLAVDPVTAEKGRGIRTRPGVRREVLLLLCLAVLPAVLLAGVLVVDTVERLLLEQRQQQVADLARTAGRQASDLIGASGGPPAMGGRLADLLRRQWRDWDGLLGWEIVTSEGLRLAGTGFVDRMRVAPQGDTPSVRRRYAPWRDFLSPEGPATLDVAVSLAADARQGAWLQVSVSLDSVRAMVRGLSGFVFLVAALYGLAGIAVLSLLLERRIVRPLRVLEADLDNFSPDQISATPVRVDGPRELIRLADSYNAMMAALAESRARTEQAQAALVRSERMASVGHLAAGMAHEIGNPLGAISGYLELLATELRDRRQLAEVVGFAQAETERIDRLLRELLEFARPDSGEQACDAVDVVRQTLELLEHQGAFRQVAIEAELPETALMTGCPASRLQQVLVNLLLNARDACGEAGKIRVRVAATGSWVRTDIQDTGRGISAENLDKVFDPFYTTKQPGQGWGLGLSICHRIVEDCDGRIDIDSEPGKGSTFSVLLPLLTEEEG
ncbi:MAG: sensor histidine kinase [Deltaproteobacteria bacterium]|nr:MAG: sensor histidine kinase [Deltaproteobacteria bacterium]